MQTDHATRQHDLDPNPIEEFLKWYVLAEQSGVITPDAMTLATATRSGIPSARIVLYKGLNSKGLRFFTNYRSRKGKELISNPRAALVFFWPKVKKGSEFISDRQIRIEGTIQKLSGQESNSYWVSRPRGSQIGAHASEQSTIVPNREVLEKKVALLNQKYEGKDIPRPLHWGGFCLIPSRFEFWISGDSRLHDRFCYIKKKKGWELARLSP